MSDPMTPEEFDAMSSVLHRDIHDREHPDIDRFLFDKERFIGLDRSDVYPNILKILKIITENTNINVVKMLVGSGGGKSYLVSLILAYKIDDFVSYVNPQQQFGLSSGTSVAIMNLSVNAGQALNVIFKNSKTWINRVKSFKNLNKKLLVRRDDIVEKYSEAKYMVGNDPNIVPEPYREARAEIEFPQKNLLFIAGHSKAASFYGYSVFAGTIDEADHIERETRFRRKTAIEQETTYTEELFGGIRKAIFTRFKKHGLLLLISTPLAKTSFLTSRVSADRIEGQEISLDDCHLIVEGEQLPEERPLCYYQKSKESGVDGYEISIIAPTWVMTGERRDKYIKSENDVKAKRDFGCEPPDAASGAMPDPDIIAMNSNKNRVNPWDEQRNIIDFAHLPLDPRAIYYFHADLALTTDNVGLALAHYNHDSGRYIIDFFGNIFTSPQKPFDFSLMENILLSLHQRGFRIGQATFDGFQSANLIQRLNSIGINAGMLSADKSKGPYDTLISLHLQDMLDYPPHPQYEKEMRYLEDMGDKYDHPSKFPSGEAGAKDVADSASCVIYNCALNMTGLLIPSNDMQLAVDGVVDVNSVVEIGDKELPLCKITDDYQFVWSFPNKTAPLHNRSAYVDAVGDDVLLVIGYRQISTFIVDFVDVFEATDPDMVPTVMANLRGMKCQFVASAPTAPWTIIDTVRKSNIRHISADAAVSEKSRQKHVRAVRTITFQHLEVMVQAIRSGTLKFCNDSRLVRELYEITENNYDTKPFAMALAGWLHYNQQEQRGLSQMPMPQSVWAGGSATAPKPNMASGGEKKLPKSVFVRR
jgi:hypothetical protein